MKPLGKYRLLMAVFYCFLLGHVAGQHDIETDLLQDLGNAASPSARVHAINALSHFYYSTHREKEADVLIDQMILIAEQSQNDALLRVALFTNPSFTLSTVHTISVAEQKDKFVQRALAYAQRVNDPALSALAYIQVSACYQANGNLEKADYFAELAGTNAMASENDSAIILSYLQQGNVNQQMSRMVISLRNFSNALDIAQEKHLPNLETLVYHTMARLYKDLQKLNVSRELILKSIAINRQSGNAAGLMNDFINMAKMCDKWDRSCMRQYLDSGYNLADSLDDSDGRMECKKLRFYALYEHVTSDSMLHVLGRDSELLSHFMQSGPGNLDWTYAQVYLYDVRGRNADSALYHLKRAEDPLYQTLVLPRKRNFIYELAMANELENKGEAIENYKLLLNLFQLTQSWGRMAECAEKLMKLYEYQGDIPNAYAYSKLYDSYTKKYNDQSRRNEVDLITLENDRKENQRQQQLALETKRREYNLQYMFIGVIIAVLFTALAMMGFYQVSRRTLRMVSFFSFLLLFEFVTLLSKKWMTYITHGTPWQDMLFMIALAMLMLPMHHWLEHQVMEYLTTRNMLKSHDSTVTRPGRTSVRKSPSFGKKKGESKQQEKVD